MKINLNDIFDNADIKTIDKIPESSLNTNQNNELNERIANKTLKKLNLESKSKKVLRFPVKRLLAVACVIAVFAGGTTVGAANYFKPDNPINQMLELNGKVDYSTLGTDVDATASSKGLDFHIGQVLCDNNIILVPIECPKYDGKYVQPNFFTLDENGTTDNIFKLLIDGKEANCGMSSYNGNDALSYQKNLQKNICYINFHDLKNIRKNTKISIIFDSVQFFDAEEIYDICDVQGYWEFNFTINRSNTRKKLDVNDIIFENGEHYISKSFTISPIGFTYDFKLKYEETAGTYNTSEIVLPERMPKFNTGSSILFSEHLARSLQGKPVVIIEMNDGTIYTDNEKQHNIESSCSMSANKILKTNYGDITATFNSAIDVENIKTITILDKVIYEK